MRLFVAVELPPAVRTAAGRAADRLRDRIVERAPRAGLRWIDPANLHITLHFLGEVADARVMDLERSLQPPLDVDAFDVALRGAGAFPERGPVRALWLGIDDPGHGLAAVHRALADRLEPLGFPTERRAFTAHLTVARGKEMHRADATILRRLATDIPPVEHGGWRVTETVLYRSRLSPKGAQYESRLRVPLR